jgi:integrase
MGKGKKPRSCPLWPETVEALKAYLAARSPRNAEEKKLFLNANGAALSRFGLRYITKKYGSKAEKECRSLDSKTLGPHTFRHSTAMHLLRAGAAKRITAREKMPGLLVVRPSYLRGLSGLGEVISELCRVNENSEASDWENVIRFIPPPADP